MLTAEDKAVIEGDIECKQGGAQGSVGQTGAASRQSSAAHEKPGADGKDSEVRSYSGAALTAAGY